MEYNITGREFLDRIKSHVIKNEDYSHPATKAWVYELRNNNRTKKIYAEDPYAEVYRFRDSVYGIYTENADGMGDPWIYLILGTEKALVIDNGFGIGDLKGLVQKIAGGREIIAAITHAHPDHSYGSCQFDTVYCHEYNRFFMEQQQSPAIWDYLFDRNGSPKWLYFDRNDIIPFRNFNVCYCEDGYTFDLGGGYEVEMVHFPGHTSGHCGFLDRTSRIFFSGDNIISSCIGACGAIPSDPNAEYATLTAYRDGIQKLIGREKEFDAIFPGHFTVDIGREVLPYILDACDAILENPNDYDFTTTRFGHPSYHKFVRGLGSICYSLDKI